MKHQILSLAIILSLFSCNCENAQPEKQWYKGNLHTHSYWSDGDEFPEVIMDWYKSNGYNFVGLSDHNIIQEGEFWKSIRKGPLYEEAFRNYLSKYGEDWVTYQLDSLGHPSVKLKTLEEYRTLTEEKGRFLLLKSEEISDHFEGKPIHMNATNVQDKINPQGGNSVADVIQNNLNAVYQQRKESGEPIMPHLNHPNFGWAVSLDDMIALENERFFEVFNGHPAVHNFGDSLHLSTEEMWDLINIAYLQDGKSLLYGLATDDSHHYHIKGKRWSNSGRGWVMVQADSLHAHSLIDAMESGNFYASTGVELKKVDFDGSRLLVEVLTAEEGGDKSEGNMRVESTEEVEKGENVEGNEGGESAESDKETYRLEFIGVRKSSGKPEILKTVEGETGEFVLDEDILFVRCRITSSKEQENPVEGMKYEMAWTQPVKK